MKRLDPALNGGSTQYIDGNPTTGAGGTVLQADALNHVQEEIANVIEHEGGALNPALKTQLRDKLIALANAAAIAALATKADAAATTVALASKADATATTAALASKYDKTQTEINSQSIEIGRLGGVGDRYAFIDLHSHGSIPDTDFSARLFREPGVNGIFGLANIGSGQFRFTDTSGVRLEVPAGGEIYTRNYGWLHDRFRPYAGVGVFTLPAGGTWAFFWANGGGSISAGYAAGGTTIGAGFSNVNYIYMRVS